MNNYNSLLSSLRKEKNLSLREAAEQSGVNRWKLYFYENGYFRPTKKDLEKLNKFYNTELPVHGYYAYPAPTKEKELKLKKDNLRTKRIIFGLDIIFTRI